MSTMQNKYSMLKYQRGLKIEHPTGDSLAAASQETVRGENWHNGPTSTSQAPYELVL
jgi:hypothetical protein